LGSSGAQVGTGTTLTRFAVTLFCVEADEIWVVAAAPVRARTTTRERMASFIGNPFLNPQRLKVIDIKQLMAS
jgi:hypothetical protein